MTDLIGALCGLVRGQLNNFFFFTIAAFNDCFGNDSVHTALDTTNQTAAANALLLQELLDAMSSDQQLGPDTLTSTCQDTDAVDSLDPNDISGPSGFGSLRWVPGGGPLAYGLFFTNDKTAASARDIVISDPLDKATLDINSLILGPISVGDQQVVPPSVPLSALGSFSADIDLRPVQDLIARLTSSLDVSTGVLTWHFESINPATGQPPTDPFLGFLLPGAEGSVTFSIKAKPGALTGTKISQKGTVFFDGKPLDTPVWFNTVDNTAPVSHVGALPTREDTSCFRPQWTGSDSGAGLQNFNVLVSDDGGPFSAWLDGTKASNALFKGEAGHSYGFYSLARDFVGNIQTPKRPPMQ